MKLSLSKQGFASKPKNGEVNVYFNTVELNSPVELLDKLLHGHIFAFHYPFEGDYLFNGHGVRTDNYIGSWIVHIDCDHQKVCMDDFIETMTDKPTFAYESFSNCEVDYRYHLVYCFDEEILGKENYKKIFEILCSRNNIDFDQQAASPCGIYHGTSPKAKVYPSGFPNKIYKVSDFLSQEDIKVYNQYTKVSNLNNINNISSSSLQHNLGMILFSKQLTDAITKLGYEDAYKSLMGARDKDGKEKYRHFDATPILLEAPEDEPLIPIPQDYYEICSYFIFYNGKSHPLLRKDGQGRKRSLYMNCRIRRLIMPDCTHDDLLYSLCYDMWKRIDNSKDPITLDNLIDIVCSAMEYDMTEFKYQRPREHKVNLAFCEKYGYTPLEVAHMFARQAGNKKKKELKENKKQLFLSLYDGNLTIKANIEKIQTMTGNKYSMPTIKRWLKEENITKYKKRSSTEPQKEVGGTTVQEETEKPTEGLKRAENKVISIKLSKPYPRITDDEGYWMVNEGYAIAY